MTTILRTLIVALVASALTQNLDAQTFTSIMSGESSEAFAFVNSSTSPRSSVTSIQSPFGFPNTTIGATDTKTYPGGNSTLTPPWWFYYSDSSYTMQDITDQHPYRSPSYGQTSSQKSGVIGIRPMAAFSGSVSGTSGEMIESIYFSERSDWAGEREFGFYRDMKPSVSLDKMYFYWSINSNCSVHDNMGYSYCRTSQASSNVTENPNLAPLAPEYLLPSEITGLTNGTTYDFIGYLFWATWDSTYKFRVEAWDATHSTQIAAFNVDTSSSGVNYGATTSGLNGYVTAGTLRIDASGGLSSTGVQLSLTSLQIAQ